MFSRFLCFLPALSLVFLSVGLGYVAPQSAGIDMTRSVQKFAELLSDQQRVATLLDFETPQRAQWHFVPKDQRKGLQIKDMNESQRELAHQLLRDALSQIGYDKAVKIMALESILHELEKQRSGGAVRDAERYYFTLFGNPSEQGKWGLSVEGHHLSLNFVVDQGQVVASTPAFFGSNPAVVKSQVAGAHPVGTRVLAKEETVALELVNSLNEEQRRTALIAEIARKEIRAAGEVQPPTDPAVGIAVGQLDDAQKQVLRQLVEAYLESMPDEVHQARAARIRQAGLDKVRFAWAGATQPGVGHYYRVQGPTFLIEFVNTQPDSAGNPANHIHCVCDMQGDFAIPLAAQ